jgi:DNA-binding NarL/FixJ family response regulator
VKKLRILIADDHGLVRRGAVAVLRARNGWRVVGEAANGREAVEKAIKLKPDVAILDIGMPELDGFEATQQIVEAVPDTKVLVLTMHESDQMVRRALDAGARGYLLKSDLTEYLAKAVKAIAAGKRFFERKTSMSARTREAREQPRARWKLSGSWPRGSPTRRSRRNLESRLGRLKLTVPKSC